MKNLRTSFLCACITICSLGSAAQQQDHTIPINQPNLNKPKLFQALPDNVPVSIDNLATLLKTPMGSTVGINLSDKVTFRFEGQVISAVSKYNNTIQSVVINSTNYPGARLTLSRISNGDGSVSYTGRIVSFKHGDLFELKKQQDGSFILIKRNFYELVNE
jgi:hypothetical protein